MADDIWQPGNHPNTNTNTNTNHTIQTEIQIKIQIHIFNTTLEDWVLVDDIWDLGNNKQPTVYIPPRDKQPKWPYGRSLSFCFPALLYLTFDFIILAPRKKVKLRLVQSFEIISTEPEKGNMIFFWNSYTPKDVHN